VASLFNLLVYENDAVIEDINTYYTTFVPTNSTFTPQSTNLTSS